MKKISCLFLFLVPFLLAGQSIEKVKFSEKETSDYYLALRPASREIRGVIVLLPGFGEAPEAIFPESKIYNVAYGNQLMVVSIGEGQKLCADENVIDKLDRALKHLIKNNAGLEPDKFVIGGFSAGGTVSLRYAEYCYEHPEKSAIHPAGVFAVDSPVDLFGIWNYFEREVRKNYSTAGVSEANAVMEIMTREIGTPKTNPSRYNALTPFNRELTESGNEKFLKDIAVRVYEDLDPVWQLENRRRSLYDNNAADASELINRLLLLGNDKAEFIRSKTPGYRSNGMRHPHSWSIVDEIEMVQWTIGLFQTEQPPKK